MRITRRLALAATLFLLATVPPADAAVPVAPADGHSIAYDGAALGLTLPSAVNTTITTSAVDLRSATVVYIRLKMNNAAATNPTSNAFFNPSQPPAGDVRPFVNITAGTTGDSMCTITIFMGSGAIYATPAGPTGVSCAGVNGFIIPTTGTLQFSGMANVTFQALDVLVMQ